MQKDCTKVAVGDSVLCSGHGGGKRFRYVDCSRGARGKSGLYCVAHGGGRRCEFAAGCTRGAIGSTMFCRAHGGGKRCLFDGGVTGMCKRSVHGGSQFCVAHGGGKRCAVSGCTRTARRQTDYYCVVHGSSSKRRKIDLPSSSDSVAISPAEIAVTDQGSKENPEAKMGTSRVLLTRSV